MHVSEICNGTMSHSTNLSCTAPWCPALAALNAGALPSLHGSGPGASLGQCRSTPVPQAYASGPSMWSSGCGGSLVVALVDDLEALLERDLVLLEDNLDLVLLREASLLLQLQHTTQLAELLENLELGALACFDLLVF